MFLLRRIRHFRHFHRRETIRDFYIGFGITHGIPLSRIAIPTMVDEDFAVLNRVFHERYYPAVGKGSALHAQTVSGLH